MKRDLEGRDKENQVFAFLLMEGTARARASVCERVSMAYFLILSVIIFVFFIFLFSQYRS